MRTSLVAVAAALGSLAFASGAGDANPAHPANPAHLAHLANPAHRAHLAHPTNRGNPASPTKPRLPAPVTITAGARTYRIARDGRVRRVVPTPLPFPRDAAWFPASGSWFAIRHRHLVIGRWGKTLWRSRGEFPARFDFDVAVVQGTHTAFSYGLGGRQRLYIAGAGGSERLLGRAEFPLGWTSGGLFTFRYRGRQLLLRDDAGAPVETVARRPLEYSYDAASQSVYFVAGGALWRAAGTVIERLVPLAPLGLLANSSLMMQPLGGLLELAEGRRLIVLRPDGSVFAETLLPRQQSVDSQIAVAPGSPAVAFSASRQVRPAKPDPARGALDLETVYLLRAGTQTAAPVHSERVQFAPCLGGANVEWHGRWLLFSAGEGSLALIDTGPSPRTIELTRPARHLLGADGSFGAYWGSDPLAP